jgi:hypothetical protein
VRTTRVQGSGGRVQKRQKADSRKQELPRGRGL